MRTLFLQAPSFDGFDGGAGSRYQARREIRSFWYPTWLAQPAALVEGSKLDRRAAASASKLAADRGERARLRSRRAAHLGAVIRLRRRDHQGAQGSQPRAQGRACRRQSRGRPGRQPESVAADRFRRPQRIRLHHQGNRRRPLLERNRRPVLSQRRGRDRAQRRARRSSRTWTACRSSRRSTSATSTSRTISSAI